MTPPVIPAEAVEAAHEQLEAMGAYVSRDYVEAALEAAAPHMLAAAFDVPRDAWGEAASWSDSRPGPEQVQRWLRSRANTYRTH